MLAAFQPSPSTDEVRMNDSSPWTLLGPWSMMEGTVDEPINMQDINDYETNNMTHLFLEVLLLESCGHQCVSLFSVCQILLVHAPTKRCYL